MTGPELAAWRRRYAESQATLADHLGVHRVTVANWERGAHPIPRHAEKMIAYLSRRRPVYAGS